MANLTIYKYPLQLEVEQWIPLPRHGRILSVQPQSDQLMLWALVDTDDVVIGIRRILLRGTGTRDYIDPNWNHLTTWVTNSGYVWHIFEDPETR